MGVVSIDGIQLNNPVAVSGEEVELTKKFRECLPNSQPISRVGH